MPGQESEDLASERCRPGFACVAAEQSEPMCLVAAFSFREGQQDGAFLTATVLGEVTVNGGFGTLVGEVLPPPFEIGGAGGSGRWGQWICGVIRFSVLRHEDSWA